MDRTDILKTVTVLVLALLIAHLIFGARWLLWLAVLLCLGNAFESRATAAVARYWMRFARMLGSVNSRILLTLLFYLVLTPLAFLYRIFNRDKAAHFLENRKTSYFEEVRKTYGPEDFEKLW